MRLGTLGSRISVGLRKRFAKLFSAAVFPVVGAECWPLLHSRHTAAGVLATMSLVLDNGADSREMRT